MTRSIRRLPCTPTPYSRPRSNRRPSDQITPVPVRLPLQDPPAHVLDFIIQYQSYELPLHVTSRTPERAVKYFLVLRMFPLMRELLRCPADQLPHTVAVTGSGEFQFQCSKCDIQTVPTRLSPEQLQALKTNFQVWLNHRREESERTAQAKWVEKTVREIEKTSAAHKRFMKKIQKEVEQVERECKELDKQIAKQNAKQVACDE
ncbi:hypothetical protein VKT23_017858 [Stygiomarasmius scandens]|uniref:Uncharacterized protein n=1 Tax=Marasmiellus scandens TaxID=2682957 RepID=A0ABR1IU52_9AGAR